MPILLPDLCFWNNLKVSVNRCFQSTGLGRVVLSQCRPPRSGSVVGEGRRKNTAGIVPSHGLCSGLQGSEECEQILEWGLHE